MLAGRDLQRKTLTVVTERKRPRGVPWRVQENTSQMRETTRAAWRRVEGFGLARALEAVAFAFAARG